MKKLPIDAPDPVGWHHASRYVTEERQRYQRFLEWLRAEEAEPFEGWDFSHLQGRMVEEPLPWDYARLLLDTLPGAEALLDMGHRWRRVLE